MRRAVAGIWGSPTTEGTPALVVTAAFFALGGLLGCFLAFQADRGGDQILSGYLAAFLSSAQDGALNLPDLPGLIWRTARWPGALFLLGFTALGLLGIPALSVLRGFFLAFSISSFARVYGRAGLSVAFLLLGIPGLLSVPVFLLMAAQSFSAAWSLACRSGAQGGRSLPYHRDYFLRCGGCAAAVVVCIFLEHQVIPVLVSGAAGALLS
ncbi:MAG: stage II sporulation protein M [Clostridiales bacterium]|nr:stage II sporulation protein M [Clostridiales bacterium]